MNLSELAIFLNENETTLTKMAIPYLKTPAKAQKLYQECPEEMKKKVMNVWEKLVKEKIPILKTPEECITLCNESPGRMLPILIKRLEELIIPIIKTDPEKTQEIYRKCPRSMKLRVVAILLYNN